MNQRRLRSLAVALAVALAVVVPGLVMGLHLGLGQAQFAAQGDTTLRAAGYAFAIWGPLYLGLVAYAAYQWGRDSDALTAFGWPSVVSAACCAGWIVTTALNLRWLSVAIIVAGAAAAAIPLLRGGGRGLRGADRWLVVWPNALLAGWLLVAAALAVITVLTAEGAIPPDGAPGWAFAGLSVVTLAGLALATSSHLAVVLAPIVWGLIGVGVAERLAQPPVAIAAAAAAALLMAVGLRRAFGHRRQEPASPVSDAPETPGQRGPPIGV